MTQVPDRMAQASRMKNCVICNRKLTGDYPWSEHARIHAPKPCPRCKGKAKLPGVDPCKNCSGSGYDLVVGVYRSDSGAKPEPSGSEPNPNVLEERA